MSVSGRMADVLIGEPIEDENKSTYPHVSRPAWGTHSCLYNLYITLRVHPSVLTCTANMYLYLNSVSDLSDISDGYECCEWYFFFVLLFETFR